MIYSSQFSFKVKVSACMYTAKIKWLVLIHIRLPQLQPQHQRMCSYMQCNKITLLGSQDRLAFFGGIEMKICSVNCPNGSFLPSEIGW